MASCKNDFLCTLRVVWVLQHKCHHHHPFDQRSGWNIHGDFFLNTTNCPGPICTQVLSIKSWIPSYHFSNALCPLGTRRWEVEIFLYLPDSNDQQAGDAFPWFSKIKVLYSTINVTSNINVSFVLEWIYFGHLLFDISHSATKITVFRKQSRES